MAVLRNKKGFTRKRDWVQIYTEEEYYRLNEEACKSIRSL